MPDNMIPGDGGLAAASGAFTAHQLFNKFNRTTPTPGPECYKEWDEW